MYGAGILIGEVIVRTTASAAKTAIRATVLEFIVNNSCRLSVLPKVII